MRKNQSKSVHNSAYLSIKLRNIYANDMSNLWWCSLIVQVRVVLRRTVVGIMVTLLMFQQPERKLSPESRGGVDPSLAFGFLAARLQWCQSVVIGQFRYVSNVRSF